MKFEEFEQKILEKGFGVVAMNHYSMNGQRYMYCVVLGKESKVAIKAEGLSSEHVFDEIWSQMA